MALRSRPPNSLSLTFGSSTSSTEQVTPGSSRGITRTGPITVDFSG